MNLFFAPIALGDIFGEVCFGDYLAHLLLHLEVGIVASRTELISRHDEESECRHLVTEKCDPRVTRR